MTQTVVEVWVMRTRYRGGVPDGSHIEHLEKGYEFVDSLQFKEFYQGRSALGAVMLDTYGNEYPLPLDQFETLLKGTPPDIDAGDKGLVFTRRFRITKNAGYTRIELA